MAVALAVVELGRHGGGEVLIVGYAVAVDGPGPRRTSRIPWPTVTAKYV